MANKPLTAKIIEIPINKIWPNPEQPRNESWGDLEGLKATMENEGLVQYPIVIRKDQPKGNGRFMLISGERRWKAAKMGGIKKMFCIWRKDIKEKDIFVLSFMENLQRQPLNPIEEAKSFVRLLKEFHGISVADLAKKLGVSQPKIYNSLKLLELPDEIQRMVADKKISPVTVSGLHSVPKKETKIKIAKKIVNERLSGKEAQELIVRTMARENASFSDGRTAKEVMFERSFRQFSNSIISISDLFDFWKRLDKQSEKNFLENLKKDKKLMSELNYARKLLNEIGERLD
jgi:ParB/RepB/Spo0J family partition protein